jgi:hypothetical protein
MHIRELILAGLFICCWQTTAQTTESVSTIGEDEAVRLAAEAYHWSERYIDYDRRDHSFFVFAPLGGEYGTAPVTWLGVNPWTGDVWDVWDCRRLSTGHLRRSQAAIRRRFRPGEMRQYARLHRLRPICYGP